MAGGKSQTASRTALAADTSANRWIALLTTAPTDDTGTGIVEVTGGAYARVEIQAADWNAPATSASFTEYQTNANAKTFPQATANWGTVAAWALMSAATGGTMSRWGDLVDGSNNPTTQAINTGTTFSIAAGTLKVSEF